MTETQRRAWQLIERLKDRPEYSTWYKIGADLGFPWAINGVVRNIRQNPNRYGGTIQYVALSSTHHFIGFAWRNMPKWYAQAGRLNKAIVDESWRLRNETGELVDDIYSYVLNLSTVDEMA